MEFSDKKLIWSVNRAMLGVDYPRLKIIRGRWSTTLVELFYYFQNKVTDEDFDVATTIGSEVIADYPEGVMIEEKYLVWDEQVEPNSVQLYPTEEKLTFPSV